MKLRKALTLFSVVLLGLSLSFRVCSEFAEHGAKVGKMKSGSMSMHQMKALPVYTPPDELNDLVHLDIKILKLNRPLKSSTKVDKYLAQYKIIILKLEKEQLIPENAEKLKKWVENGGVLWLDDGWSASTYFGVKEEISPSSLVFSREDESIRKDPLSTAVSDLAFLNGYYMIPDESFTEVIRQEDRVYLAYKSLGKGKLVYYPSGLTEKLDYYRLMLNLREWSAGYGVPALVGSEIKDHQWDED